jgi:hypothetical protein
MKPKAHAGAGKPPYMFKTDSSGAGTYESGLKASPFWEMADVDDHASPQWGSGRLENAMGALSAKLMK